MKRIILIALLACSGCASYEHERIVREPNAAGEMVASSEETEKYRSFLKVGKASGIKIESARNGPDYIHNLGVDQIEASGDAAMFRAIYDAGVTAGKTAVLP